MILLYHTQPQSSGTYFPLNSSLGAIISSDFMAWFAEEAPPAHEAREPPAARHYVRKLVEDLTIRVPFVASADNLADFFTKPAFQRSRSSPCVTLS